MTNKPKIYLGDGVYAQRDMGQLILTAENGISITNIVVLEPEVWAALLEYMKDTKDEG